MMKRGGHPRWKDACEVLLRRKGIYIGHSTFKCHASYKSVGRGFDCVPMAGRNNGRNSASAKYLDRPKLVSRDEMPPRHGRLTFRVMMLTDVLGDHMYHLQKTDRFEEGRERTADSWATRAGRVRLVVTRLNVWGERGVTFASYYMTPAWGYGQGLSFRSGRQRQRTGTWGFSHRLAGGAEEERGVDVSFSGRSSCDSLGYVPAG